MKKLSILLATLLLVSLSVSGCAGKSATSDDKAQSQTESSSDATQTEESEPGMEVNSIESLKAMTSLEVTKIMGNGINLGNTMESGSRKTLGTGSPIVDYETGWGMPVTTAEMIQGMKDAGFDTLRIPVAWTCAIDYESNDYTIRPEFIERIAQIVDYALAADMFVVVNDHWDNQWWGMFGDSDKTVSDRAMTLYIKMWEGISTYFAGYDERLIFESANEELGNRLNDNWKDFSQDASGCLSKDECYSKANEINQAFVDTVRKTGGNNDHRFLLIAGYDTNIAATCDDRFKMPTDTASDKLILSVHYYDPSNYCIFKSTDKWGMKADYMDMNESLKMLTKFTDAGYGVIIGEYGVLHDGKATTLRENTIPYLENFLNNCNLYGYVPLLWDCNSLYDRDVCKMSNIEAGRIFTKYSYEYEKEQDDEKIKSKAESEMQKALDNATEIVIEKGTAWIMFSSSDWNVSYAVGDDHPTGGTDGIVSKEVVITEAGTYEIGLDFTGTAGGYANSIVFAAIGIMNGEELFPDYKITIQSIKINGEEYTMTGENYTSSDDGICTRSNLYNGWVSEIPSGARTNGNLENAPASGVMIPEDISEIYTIDVTFSLEQ